MEEVIKEKQNSKILEFFKSLKFYKDIHSLFYYFLFLLLVGIVFFATSLFVNNFTTPFTGDYCSQQYAFYLNVYDDWRHFFQTGIFRYYDYNTYLGVNNLGSNSFYSLTDPFFFLVILFPRNWMAQMMAISTIVRMSIAGLVFYGYLRYMGVSKTYSKVGGLAYAYCGWTVWYLWFNCFTENAITFVLILWGVERILREKKPWLLMFALFIAGLVNYFFLIAFTMMGFIYAMYRFFQRLKYNSKKDNWIILGIGFIGFFAGLLMSSIVVLPSVMVALDAPRATSSTYLESLTYYLKHGNLTSLANYIFSWKHIDNGYYWREYFPIIEFFYPAMSDRGTPLTVFGNETYDNVSGSLFTFYPFIILLVPAIISDIRRKNYWPLVATILLIISLYTPFFYYMFFGFTKPYSRWFIFIATSLITYVSMFMDRLKDEPKWTIIIGGVFALIGVIGGAGLARYIIKDVTIMNERVDITTACSIASIYVVLLTIVMYLFLNRKHLPKILLGAVAVEAAVMGALVIDGHGVNDYITEVNYGYALNESLSKLSKQVNRDDGSYFRAWSSLEGDSNKNSGGRNDYNSASFFHSVYNFNVTDFIYWSMLMTTKTGWSGRYVEKRAGLDKLLGIKYYYVEKSDYENNPLLEGYYDNLQVNTPFDFEDISLKYPNDNFYVYQDNKHIDFALSFDTLYTYKDDEQSQLETTGNNYGIAWSALRNDELFLKGAVINENNLSKIIKDSNDYLTVESITPVGPEMDANVIYDAFHPSESVCEINTYDVGNVAKTMNVKDILDTIESSTPLASRPSTNIALSNVILITAKSGYEIPYDENGMAFYINAGYASSTKEDIYIIDESNNVITWDNHNDDRSTNASNRHGPRGFYVKPTKTDKAPKVSKILIVPRYGSFNNGETVFYESYTSFANRLKDQETYKVDNVEFLENEFRFTTNFANRRFILTQVAYDKGWSVIAKKSNGEKIKLPTYLSDGGFVGFVSLDGDVSYSMYYETPYLNGGRFLSMIGTLIFAGTLFAYIYIDLTVLKKKTLLSV